MVAPVAIPEQPIARSKGRTRFWRAPISLSVASWEGVTFTAPDPKALSTAASATSGISRSIKGSLSLRPTEAL